MVNTKKILDTIIQFRDENKYLKKELQKLKYQISDMTAILINKETEINRLEHDNSELRLELDYLGYWDN